MARFAIIELRILRSEDDQDRKPQPPRGSGVSFLCVGAPHARRHFRQIPLMNDKPWIENQFGNGLAVLPVEQGLNALFGFEIDILNARRIQGSLPSTIGRQSRRHQTRPE